MMTNKKFKNSRQTHCHCCRPFAGHDHTNCGRATVDLEQRKQLEAVKLEGIDY